MAYESVKNQIDAYIKANGVNLITGPVLNAVLTAMLDELGEGYAFQGVLNTTDTPSPAADIPQAWLASAGTYLGGSITVDEGELALIIHAADGWSKETVYRGVQLSYEAIVAALEYTPASEYRVDSLEAYVVENYQPKLESGENIKTINGDSILGEGDIETQSIDTVQVTVDDNTGTPSATGSVSGSTLSLDFHNLKGAQGPKGDTGATGPQGPQGPQGNTGSSVDYPFELADNLTTDDPTKALSAAQGVVLEGEISQLGQEINNYGEPASITETQSVASGARFDKTINLSAYVGQPIKFRVTKNGGTSVEFSVYNGNYSLGSLFSYGLEYEYVINSGMQSLRFMGTALEGSSADFEIEIEISTLYKIENVERAKLSQKVTDYSSQLISGKYFNMNNAILPTNPATLANCQCVSGIIGGGDTLIVKGTGTSKNVGLYAFYDKDRNRLFSSGAASTNNQDALEITAPAGSYYFAFNTYNDTQTDCVRVKHIYIIEEEINKVKESNAELSSRVEELNGLLWEGKKVVCFGDSITEFADSANKRYTDYLAEITKANVINVGIGGTRLACRTTPVANPSNAIQGYAALDCANLVDAVCTNDFSIVDAGAIYVRDNEGDDNTGIIAILKAIDWSSVDIVTFFIGTNDWGGAANMGTSGEISKRTTLGAVGFVISTLLTTYPHLKIYWFTPVVRWLSPRTDENWGGVVEKAGNTLEGFVELIKTESEKYCIPVCDMYHTLGWNKYNFSEYFYDSDGTHPTKGFQEIARKFASFINANRTF